MLSTIFAHTTHTCVFVCVFLTAYSSGFQVERVGGELNNRSKILSFFVCVFGKEEKGHLFYHSSKFLFQYPDIFHLSYSVKQKSF